MSVDKTHGDKRTALIAADKADHRVLILGRAFNDIPDLENASIETASLFTEPQNFDRLTNYSLVVLDYACFRVHGRNVAVKRRDIFEKQMMEALDSGTNFCFVHFEEEVPIEDPNGPNPIYSLEQSIKQFRQSQIGFKWLNDFSIKPYRSDDLIITGQLFRGEFKMFFDRWGTSYNYFSSHGARKFDDVIYSVISDKDAAIGFTLNFCKGKIIYLPFQRDFASQTDAIQGIQTLVDCLLTYITKSLTETPQWGKKPFFKDEDSIVAECEDLEKRLVEARSRLQPFNEAKNLLFQGDHILGSSIPKFIASHLDIQTEQKETYKEDFWVLDDKGEKVIIAEIKSMSKGLKVSAIYSLYNHREANNLDVSFKGLLVANCHLQAGSWAQKDRVIDKQDYREAAKKNILINRVEDLVRLWDALRLGKLKSKGILDLFLSKKGWLQVKSDLTIIEMK